MQHLRLIPLDDAIVFPGMTVTLPVDPGADTHVFIVPRRGGTFAGVGVVAKVLEQGEVPGRGVAAVFVGLHELEREYRAVVEEILELRGDDGRIAPSSARSTEPGALADTSGYSPDLTFEQKVRLLETSTSASGCELALASSASASPSCRSASASARTSSRARRSSSASTSSAADGLDPQGARRGRRSSSTEYRPRSPRPACPRPCASRPSASSAGSSAWASERRGLDDPHLPRLAARRAVGKRSEERLDPVTPARCSTPTTPASTT
jgi:hypothetical protein